MEYCPNCFKRTCRCGKSYKVEIDYYIYPAIYELNRKGYRTTNCCSGHEYNQIMNTYVAFSEDIIEEFVSDYWQYDSYNYRGFHERKNIIRIKPEIQKKYQKKRTNKLELIQAANKDLYMWARSLPTKGVEDTGEIDFPLSYFDAEVVDDSIIDIQNPWMLFTKSINSNFQITQEFFSEIESNGEYTEYIVNKAGRIKRFKESDYIHNSHHKDILKNKIEFDVSGDYKYLLCGYEKYIMIEKLLVGDSTWYLSYARTDIAAEYGEYYEMAHHDNLVDEDDIEDFWDENAGKTEIDLFECIFNRISRLGINVAVFSAENINIVFSNRTNFAILTQNGQNIIAFGNGDYEDIDFSTVHVDKKEYLMYANGSLLIRKEF